MVNGSFEFYRQRQSGRDWNPSKVMARIRRWPRRGRVVVDEEMLVGWAGGENRWSVVDL